VAVKKEELNNYPDTCVAKRYINLINYGKMFTSEEINES